MKFIHNGDCLEEMRRMKENSVDAIVTDPPYELGFMGKKWDNTGIANNKAMWAEALRVLKPGGHLLSFSGTRTYHRMACAIEDAGFEVRDMIEWVYGSGFPKSHNIGKAVDKLQGNEREVLGTKVRGDVQKAKETGSTFAVADANKNNKDIFGYGIETLTKGTSDFEGWGTALKPAHEPICMARKPISEKTVAENCLKWGTGGINIDESRVGTDIIKNAPPSYRGKTGEFVNQNQNFKKGKVEYNTGRFPANLILSADEDGQVSEEVRECFPETKSGTILPHHQSRESENRSMSGKNYARTGNTSIGDSGNASRFFKSIIYQAKASKSERNKGCEGLETKQTQGGGGGIGDYQDDVNSMSGKYGSEKAPAKNNHPTVKPIALMEYLIKMVTPKCGTVLDPFMGSGSTGVACMQTGRAFVGIELDEGYCLIAEKRINESFEKQTGEEET